RCGSQRHLHTFPTRRSSDLRNLPEQEAVRVLGKAIEHEYSLFSLLRRPEVSYPALMGLDGGRYAHADVSRETLGDLADSVVEQVDRKSTRLNSSHVKISYAV